MFKKAAALYLSFFLFAAIMSGCIVDCHCDVQNVHFKWKDLELSSSSYTLDSGQLFSEIDTSRDFSNKGYALNILLNGERLALRSDIPGFTNQAYACSCPENNFFPDARVTGVRIYTVNNYDASHSAGAEVTEYFRSAQPSGNGGFKLAPLNLEEELRSYSYPGIHLRLYLATRPGTGVAHQFRVVVTFDDGKVLNETTPELKL